MVQLSQLKQVSHIKQTLKNNINFFFVVNLMCGTLSLYVRLTVVNENKRQHDQLLYSVSNKSDNIATKILEN
jgi:predicted lysophospholipase L1 biosynthesis ABC-type transport system permease subunit